MLAKVSLFRFHSQDDGITTGGTLATEDCFIGLLAGEEKGRMVLPLENLQQSRHVNRNKQCFSVFAKVFCIYQVAITLSVKSCYKSRTQNPLAGISKRKNTKEIVLESFPYWALSKQKKIQAKGKKNWKTHFSQYINPKAQRGII